MNRSEILNRLAAYAELLPADQREAFASDLADLLAEIGRLEIQPPRFLRDLEAENSRLIAEAMRKRAYGA